MIPDISVFDSPVKLRDSYIKTHYPELYDKLCNDGYEGDSIGEKLYLYYHGLKSVPLCVHCHVGKTKYRGFNVGYAQYCCNHCNAMDQARRDKALITRSLQSEETKEEIKTRTRQTNIERYGGVGFASKELLEKTKQTNLKRYGVEYTTQSPEIREKTKQTNLKRYGVEYASQSPEIREKTKQTNLKRYGVESTFDCPEIREKAKQTCIEHYGVDNPMKNRDIFEKAKQTNLERYGSEYQMRNKTSLSKNQEARKQFYITLHNLVDITPEWTWICKCPHPECNQCLEKNYEITSKQFYGRKQQNIEPCTRILPIDNYRSKGTTIEVFIRSMLDDIGIEYTTNTRNVISPQEIDIYIPSKKIGIECNGVYWHSKYDAKYHEDKYKKCLNLGIQLISIWEDWIRKDPEKVRSLILSKLGIYDRKLFARKCIIRDVSAGECSDFLTINHIQGATKPVVRKGLYYNNELVGIMTFSKPSKLSGSKKQIDSDKWVLSRFCTSLYTQVIGGANKLLKSFINEYHPSKIESFSSNDISTGKLYEILGFEKESVTSAYWYIEKDTYNRYHRSSFTKSRLNALGYDTSSKTENEIMQDINRYYKIYDSGHTKYVLYL